MYDFFFLCHLSSLYFGPEGIWKGMDCSSVAERFIGTILLVVLSIIFHSSLYLYTAGLLLTMPVQWKHFNSDVPIKDTQMF